MTDNPFYRISDAAVALAESAEEVKRLRRESARYEYAIPPQLAEDTRRAARRVRDAVRFLVSEDADE